MREEFKLSLETNKALFGVHLSDSSIERLAAYYELIQQHNPILHLVGPCPPEEFATRHILESLTLLKHLPADARFADVGSGGGLPAIPCLIARDDLSALLIESKEKKAAFLELAIDGLGLKDRAEVVAKQFAESEAGDATFVTCRALDKFPERVQKLVRWAGRRNLLLFGGEQIGKALQVGGIKASAELMPLSERRFLFVVKR